MANLTWQTRRNLENSLYNFLVTQLTSTTVFYKGANQAIDVRVGNTTRDDWALPVISVYVDSKTAPRGFVGSNRRLESFLMIIDIRALNDEMRSDLAELITDTINDGFDYYDYTPNVADPDNPSSVLGGKVSVDFVTDIPLRPVNDADKYDKYRHRISVNLTITAT